MRTVQPAPTGTSRTTAGKPASHSVPFGAASREGLIALQQRAGNQATAAFVEVQRKKSADAASAGEWAAVAGMIGSAVGTGAVMLLVALGYRDEKQLTNFLFWAAHPEVAGQRIQAGQKALARDWLRIRAEVVRPKLAALRTADPAVRSGGGDGASAGPGGAKSEAGPKAKSKPGVEVGPAAGEAPPAVDMTGGSNRAYKLDWDRDASAFNIDAGDTTLRAAFEAELRRQLKVATGGELDDWEAATAVMEQAARSGDAARAEALRRQLWQARQYALVETLNVQSSERYLDTKKDNKLSTYCNIYAHDMVTAMGAYLPRVWWTTKAAAEIQAGKDVKPAYGKTIREMRANDLWDWMKTWGPSFGWSRTADIDAAQAAANAGSIVIVLAARKGSGSGHVSVILAESAAHKAPTEEGERTSPLQSQAGTWNFGYSDTAPGTAQHATAGSDKKAGAAVGQKKWWEAKRYRSDTVIDEATGEKVPAGNFFIHDGSTSEGVLPRP